MISRYQFKRISRRRKRRHYRKSLGLASDIAGLAIAWGYVKRLASQVRSKASS